MSEQALDQHLDQLSEDEEIEHYLKLELKDLAKVRISITKTKEDLVYAQELLEERIEYKEVLACKDELKVYAEAQKKLETDIKDDAVRASKLSGYKNRKPAFGVEVKKFIVVTIVDEKKAKICAANNAPSTISISKSKFDKVMKVLKKDFVKVKPEYRAQVSSNLSEYLDEN